MTTPSNLEQDGELVAKIMQSAAMQEAIANLDNVFASNMKRITHSTVGRINAVMGMGLDLPDLAARQIIADGGTHLVGMDIAGQTRQSLFNALAESRVQGLHPSSADTFKLINDHVTAGRFKNAGVRYRAKLIARTETMYAQNESSLAAYDASLTINQVQAADDLMGHGDDECAARDGAVFTIQEARNIADHPNGSLRWLPVT